MAPARTASIYEVSGGKGLSTLAHDTPSGYTSLLSTMPLSDHFKGQTLPTAVFSRTVNKEQAYEQDAKNAVGIAVGVTFGLLGLVLAMGALCYCVSWRKSGKQNRLGRGSHRTGIRKVSGQPQHPRVRFVSNSSGGRHIPNDAGCLELLCAGFCGAGYSSGRGGQWGWSNSTRGRGGLGRMSGGGGNGGRRLFGRGHGNNNCKTKLDARIGRCAQRRISRTALSPRTRGRNEHQLRTDSRNDRLRRSQEIVRKSGVFPLERIPLPAHPPGRSLRDTRDHAPIDGSRAEQLRARSTRYQTKSLELRETAVPSQVIPFPYGPPRRRGGPSNIGRPPQVYIPGSSRRLGQVRETRREGETRRIREIHTRVRSRSGRNSVGFISGGGGSLGPSYQTSPSSAIHSTSSRLRQPSNVPWSNSSNIPPSSPTRSECTQCSSQPSYLAEHTCCQSSSTSSLDTQHHFFPSEYTPGSARTSDEFTSQVSAGPTMSSDPGCYSLEELESNLETITEDEFHESTRSSLWSTEPFNHGQKYPSIEMEHPGSLVNFCSSTTSNSVGSDTVHATSKQEPPGFAASHTSPQTEVEGAAATSSSRPCAVKRPQSPRPSNQSPSGYGRIHAPTPAIITITTQTFEGPASSAGHPHSSTATTCASLSPSTSFKTPNESSVVGATPGANPDAVAPLETSAPTILSPIHTEIIPNIPDQLSLPVEHSEKPGEQGEPENKPQKSVDVRSNVSSSLSFPIHHDGCSICTFVPYEPSNANSVASPRGGSSSRNIPFPSYQSISPRGTMLMRSSAVSPNSRNLLSRVFVGEPIVDLQRELREAQLRQELERLGGIPNRVAGPAASLQATVESVAGDSDDTGGVGV